MKPPGAVRAFSLRLAVEVIRRLVRNASLHPGATGLFGRRLAAGSLEPLDVEYRAELAVLALVGLHLQQQPGDVLLLLRRWRRFHLLRLVEDDLAPVQRLPRRGVVMPAELLA